MHEPQTSLQSTASNKQEAQLTNRDILTNNIPILVAAFTKCAEALEKEYIQHWRNERDKQTNIKHATSKTEKGIYKKLKKITAYQVVPEDAIKKLASDAAKLIRNSLAEQLPKHFAQTDLLHQEEQRAEIVFKHLDTNAKEALQKIVERFTDKRAVQNLHIESFDREVTKLNQSAFCHLKGEVLNYFTMRAFRKTLDKMDIDSLIKHMTKNESVTFNNK